MILQFNYTVSGRMAKSFFTKKVSRSLFIQYLMCYLLFSYRHHSAWIKSLLFVKPPSLKRRKVASPPASSDASERELGSAGLDDLKSSSSRQQEQECRRRQGVRFAIFS